MGNILYRIIFLLSIQFLASGCHAQKSQDKDMITYHTARVIEHPDQDYAEVVFLESARFYKLPKKTKGYEDYLKLLKESVDRQVAVKIKLTVPNGEIIEKVAKGD